MRHYSSDEFDGQFGFNNKQNNGKYAARRDIARNGKAQKASKGNFKPRPSRNNNHHADLPDGY